MRNNVIVDIDHVISHAAPRDHLLGGDWDVYHEAGKNDLPCDDMHNILCSFKYGFHTDLFIIACTGRPEKWRQQTNEWLLKHRFPIDVLLMRPNKCFLPAGECKVNLVKGYFGDCFAEEILCVIDDNDHVIEAFQKVGVTCLQVYGREYK